MYNNYVNNIKASGYKRLVMIPLLIAFFIYLAPPLFQVFYNIIFPAPLTEIGSISATLGMGTTLIIAVLIMSRIVKLKLSDLGITSHSVVRSFLMGVVAGLSLLSIVVLLIFLLQGVEIRINKNFTLFPFIIGLIFFIFQGTWEELIYRAYLMPHFSKIFGNVISIIITSSLFTLGHALNPGMQILPVINLFIASIVFSLTYFITGNLWIVGISHGIWNFTQGFVFGSEVSGNRVSSSIFLSTAKDGKDLLSGGSFGFEGGLVTTLVGLIIIVSQIYVIRRGKENLK